MAHFARTRATWTDGIDVPTAADLTDFETKMFKAVNGDDGGSWAPAAGLYIGGSGVKLQGAFHELQAGALLTCDGDIDMNGVMSLLSGSTLTINAAATFILGGTSRVQLQSRSLTRVQPFLPVFTAGEFDTPTGSTGALKSLTSSNKLVTFPLHLPHGSTLTQVRVSILPLTGRVLLPSTMPRLRVYAIATDGSSTLVGTAIDSSATIGFYEGQHYVALGGLSHTVDRATKRYVAEFMSETGPGALAGLLVFGVEATFTLTSMDDAGA